MRRAAALSSLRSCVRATSVYSIVQAKILSHFLRSESATLPFAKAFHDVSRKIVIFHLVDVGKDHLADIEGLRAPRLLRQDVETAFDVFRKSNRSRHQPLRRYEYRMYSLYHGALCPKQIPRNEEHIRRTLP